MMKVAIAGTNGLAQYIANFIDTTTSHQFVILSRRTNQGLTQQGWQILVADYENPTDLQFKLAGVDVVISTISGRAQLALINAAAVSQVRRFVPSEFAGNPGLRPANDPFDHGRHAALQRLAQLEPMGMNSTVFSCGLFYERFAPGGLQQSQLGLSSHIAGEGEYLLDFRRCRAEVPYYSIAGPPVYVCMTSAQDAARAVVASLDLASWPKIFQLRGDRLTVEHVVGIAEQVRGQLFERSIYTLDSLQDALVYARAVRETARETQLQHLVATAEGRYDFQDVNWPPNESSFLMESFAEWLIRVWSSRPA